MTSNLPQLPLRRKESHKGDFGRLLLIGGSRGMSGAIALAGMAALRSGAGLVKLAVADCILDTVAGFEPSYMTVGLPCDDEGRIAYEARVRLRELSGEATCAACGPGLGRSRGLDNLIHWLYTTLPIPIVFDADGLNALAEMPDTMQRPAGPRVLTPHPGEFRRLCREQFPELSSYERAHRLAATWRAIVVLKGHPTFVTDGTQQVVCAVGNPGMATGGSGDVLTGILTALIGQGLTPFDAAHMGVHVHGLAGDLAADELGEVGMIASDLVRFLPLAFRRLGAPNNTRVEGVSTHESTEGK